MKNGADIHYYGSDCNVRRFIDVCARNPIVQLEGPDFYLVTDEIVYIIEHFEFTSYKENRKGSAYRQEESRIQRRIDGTIPTTEPTVLHDVIHGVQTYQYYTDNVTRSFKTHYSRIIDYVDHLKQVGILKQQELKVIFFIEDVSPLGSAADVSEYSPGNLRRAGRTVVEYLEGFTETESALYRDYYEDEL